MLRKYDTTTSFNYKREEGLNPYIGFVSYQHFRDEKLYSDCIVRPENNRTETEAFECYPVPDDVEENGREQGYHPDSTEVYIRALWKEFEPEVVCLGGGVSNVGEKILKPIRKAIKNYSFARFGKKQTEVQIAQLGNDAGIIGAALLWKNEETR